MPIDEVGTITAVMPYMINVPVQPGIGYFISVSIQSDGTPMTPAIVEATDEVFQDLMDYLQEWPGRYPGTDVNGQKPRFELFSAYVSNPEDQPDPEPEG